MESIHFSTEGLRAQDQFEAWREWFGSAFDVHPADSESIGFEAEYRAWQIGDLILPSSVAPPTRTVRSMTNLRRYPVDHWAISWGHDGATHYETKRGNCSRRPEFPLSGQQGRSRHILIFLPREVLPAGGNFICRATPFATSPKNWMRLLAQGLIRQWASCLSDS